MPKLTRERVSVYLPITIANEARRLASADHRTLSDFVRTLVVKEVERQNKRKQPA